MKQLISIANDHHTAYKYDDWMAEINECLSKGAARVISVTCNNGDYYNAVAWIETDYYVRQEVMCLAEGCNAVAELNYNYCETHNPYKVNTK